MPAFQVVSFSRHANQHWQSLSSYVFTSAEAIAPLSAQELPKAATALPLGFAMTEAGIMPVALQGLSPNKNLWVAVDGRWVGGYIPARYRGHPFQLVATDGGQQVLCVDEDSGLLVEADSGFGAPFFTAEGQPSPAVKEVLNFLKMLADDRVLTLKLCALLQSHQLLIPWALKVYEEEPTDRDLNGILRIDEARLQQLSGEALQELAASGALLMAYCQLLSMQHLSVLEQLAKAHAQMAAAAQAAAQQATLMPKSDLDLAFLNQSDTISFAGLE